MVYYWKQQEESFYLESLRSQDVAIEGVDFES